MPTFAVARWATARMTGIYAGAAISNRFKRNKVGETKLQNAAIQISALMLSIVVATVVATIVESGIDAVAPDSWNNK